MKWFICLQFLSITNDDGSWRHGTDRSVQCEYGQVLRISPYVSLETQYRQKCSVQCEYGQTLRMIYFLMCPWRQYRQKTWCEYSQALRMICLLVCPLRHSTDTSVWCAYGQALSLIYHYVCLETRYSQKCLV